MPLPSRTARKWGGKLPPHSVQKYRQKASELTNRFHIIDTFVMLYICLYVVLVTLLTVSIVKKDGIDF